MPTEDASKNGFGRNWGSSTSFTEAGIVEFKRNISSKIDRTYFT